MRKRSDKDKSAHAGPGTVQQIASTNWTVNLFLGGGQVRSWMNSTAEAGAPSSTSTTISRPKKRTSVLAATTTAGGDKRPKTASTVLPSPAPSDEPSPTRETDSSRVMQEDTVGMAEQQRLPVTMQEADTQEVRRPTTRLSIAMSQLGTGGNAEGQAVRRPGTLESPIMIQRGGDIDGAGQDMRRLEMKMPSMLVQQGQVQQSPPLMQQSNTVNEPQVVRSPSTQQPQMVQQRNTGNEPQAVRSPSTQQPQMVQQRNTNNEPQTLQNAWTRQPVSSGYTPQAPAPPPAKRRKMTSANHPSLKNMLPLLEHHVNAHGGMQNLSRNIERQRFQMLQKACESDDYFYFALHQIFCLYTLDPELVATLIMPQGGTVLEVAFGIIGQLMMPNSAISPVHTKFFSVFPNQLPELIHRSDQYKLTVNNVATFLARLSLEWPKYIPECINRGYPPLVDELVDRFGLLSPILQHIIFTATRRNMGIPDDEYSAQMEKLFSHDQELHRQMAARVNTAYPPTEREINERNQWQSNQYKTVRAAQLQRIEQIRQGEPSHMSPNATRPLQRPNMLGRVQSPSNIPPATQAGHPSPIRTTIMLSEVLTASPRSTTVPSPHQYPWPSQAAQACPMLPSQQILPSQAQNIQQPYQPSQPQNMQHRQAQVNDIVRTASRNASRNASLVQFPGAAGSAAPSPVLTNQPRRASSSTYSMTVPTIASMPAGYSSPQAQPQPQQKTGRVPLIPPVGYTPPYQFPQPDRSALHQAHLRSPVLKPIDADEGLVANETAPRYYQAVQCFAVKPTTLLDSPLLTELSFAVPKRVYPNIAEDKSSDLSAPMLREVRQGSLQYRVRCSRMNKDAPMEPSDFVVADTSWPPTIFMEMNDSVIEIRRKSHYGKDRPVDITPHVLERGPAKKNTLRVCVPRPPKTGNDIFYSIAIEVIEVFRHQQIIDMCLQEQRITAQEMIEDIRAKLSNANIDEDDDVALVSANLTIDLADPFTSRIFTTPVRGVRCRHRECFDLETFLISRSTKPHEVACLPDVWKCPLCGGDASPRALRVDEFLVSVRERLEREGGLDAKAILVTEDGAWTVKPEALPAGRRKSRGAQGGSVPRDESEHSSPAAQSRQGSRAVEVIEVDDD